MNENVFERRLPVIVLIGAIVFVTFADWILGFGNWMMVPNEVVTAWERFREGNNGGNIWQELFTTLSAAFLHADGSHLAGNLLFLWIFGVVVQELCGWKWLFGAFVLTAIGGSIGQIMLDLDSDIPTLGASGAVLGLEGFYFGLATLHVRQDCEVWPLARPVNSSELATAAVIGVILDFMGVIGPDMAVAYGAHIGGFVTGVLLSLVADQFIRR